jgi:hypothetical protein
MNSSDSEPERKYLPHLAPLEFHNQTILQYVTVCVNKRRPLLARPDIVDLLLGCWRKADHWIIGRWVVMPDHLHLFCAPAKLPQRRLNHGSISGGTRAHADGHTPTKNRFGSGISLTGNYETEKAIIKNGSIFGKTQ